MTEADWLACDDPDRMLSRGRDWLTERKLRLFASACCGRLSPHLKDKRSLRLVDISERFADGLASRDELQRAFDEATEAQEAIHWQGADAVTQGAAAAVLGLGAEGDLIQVFEGTREVGAALKIARSSELRRDTPGWPRRDTQFQEQETAELGGHEESVAQADLVRDILGNPFRPVIANPAWLTSTVLTLARQMYGLRDFGAMPILADALQDAGCASDDILGHCRGPGPHVRGCWVVDLVLGKT